MTNIQDQFIEVNGLRLHCLVAGEGEPLLLLHGWPTNAQLWRHALPSLGEHRRAIALDLPGFGQSDKPTGVRYSYEFYEQIIDGALEALGIERSARLGLAVHDMGGPVGLYWAAHHLERVSSLALLNTLVFPQTSWLLKAFALAIRTPFLRGWLSSPAGVAAAMRLGVVNRGRITADVARLYQEPYAEMPARRALLESAMSLGRSGLETIAGSLPKMRMPVRLIYGESEPGIAKTMARVKALIPHAEVTSLPDVGHFLQEDAPEEVAALLCDFFARPHEIDVRHHG